MLSRQGLENAGRALGLAMTIAVLGLAAAGSARADDDLVVKRGQVRPPAAPPVATPVIDPRDGIIVIDPVVGPRRQHVPPEVSSAAVHSQDGNAGAGALQRLFARLSRLGSRSE
jgi:hypothetical protein